MLVLRYDAKAAKEKPQTKLWAWIALGLLSVACLQNLTVCLVT